ncbi:MAG: hypothetical protein LBU05_01260, partial [Bifidobacteriaceae bacterium]|nr:hypothetical protein [Bifidobacteriaceae bacterium]
PVLISGYVGVILHRAVEGLAWRIGSDMILANSPHDAARFRAVLAALGRDPAAIVETRLPFLAPPTPEPAHEPGRAHEPERAHEPGRATRSGRATDSERATGPEQATEPEPSTAPEQGTGRPYTVTFAAQPSIPAAKADRVYLVRRLVNHARRHPDRRVILKVRALPGERITHAEPYPYHVIAKRLGAEAVPNFSIQAGPMSQVLARTDLLLTVSSTAAVESIHLGIATGILTDFGIEEATGLPFYLGSGCLVAMDQVDAGAAPLAHADWSSEHGLAGPAPQPSAAERLAEMIESTPGPVTPLYNRSFSPAYLSRLLASRANPGGGVIERAARAAYRAGVDVVAPALRSLGA